MTKYPPPVSGSSGPGPRAHALSCRSAHRGGLPPSVVVAMIVLLSVSSLWAQQIGGTPGAAGIRGRLPVRVAGRVFFVVPVTELPSDLQERLKGKAAFAVVDEQGRIPKDKEVIFKALVATM
jgi:hypothetical protein